MNDSSNEARPGGPVSGPGRAALRKARHDLRNLLTDILGFADVLRDEAAERGLQELTADLQAVRQAASAILNGVNHELNPDALMPTPQRLGELGDFIGTHAGEILVLAERLSERCDVLGEAAIGDDLLRIEGSARRLREQAPQVLAGIVGQIEPGKDGGEGVRAESGGDREAAAKEEPATAGGAVLVVDDSESSRALLARRLRRLGHWVYLAENGRQALDKLRTRSFDLILLDILMPEMDGFAVLRAVRADAATRHIPVILLSALDDLDAVIQGIELGADDYLPKPFPPLLLQARVRACLTNKRLADQLRKYTEWLFGRHLFVRAVEGPQSMPLQHRERTVLFADIRGFTRWTEQNPAEATVGMLNRFFEEAEKIWTGSSIVKAECQGDEIMGVFEEAVQAVAVARTFQVQLGGMLTPLGLHIGIGIHTGPVIEGLMGASGIKAYRFVGDTVNTARRLCDHAAPGEILVSEMVRTAIDPALACGEARSIQAAGKAVPLTVFRVD